MNLIGSLVIAFAMYSAIPVPQIAWNEARLKYVMVFFPLVGAVIGGILAGLCLLAKRLALPVPAFACLAAAVPVLLTGGIHMDGFLDTVDARSSHLERERKLEILKDPHVGAFAIIGGGVYLLLSVAGYCGMESREAVVYAGALVFSRAFSGWALITWKKARKDGLAQTFSEGAGGPLLKGALLVWMAAAGLWIAVWGNVLTAVLCGLTAVFVCIWYYRVAMREFGGITGDLAGYFLQLCELGLLWAVVIGGGMY